MLSRFSSNTQLLECGIDEAGRGCLAGPVTAAAVILPPDYHHPLLNDSKQTTAEHRAKLRADIEQHALAYAVCHVEVAEIDRINILNATFKAMSLCIGKLALKPELLLIDGNRFKVNTTIPHQCIVKGDGKIISIAAASILAKTYRDEHMQQLAATYPQYDWQQNKGYPTKAHKLAILKHGFCLHHRQSFSPNFNQLQLEL